MVRCQVCCSVCWIVCNKVWYFSFYIEFECITIFAVMAGHGLCYCVDSFVCYRWFIAPLRLCKHIAAFKSGWRLVDRSWTTWKACKKFPPYISAFPNAHFTAHCLPYHPPQLNNFNKHPLYLSFRWWLSSIANSHSDTSLERWRLLT